MGSASPSPQSSLARKDVKRMLTIFAVLAVAGVLMFAVSRILGLLLLVVAEDLQGRGLTQLSPSAAPRRPTTYAPLGGPP